MKIQLANLLDWWRPTLSQPNTTLLYVDEIGRDVTWKENADVSRLAGKPVRRRFAMNKADLYSLRFH